MGPLLSLKVGCEAKIRSISGEDALVERLRELGFVEGETVVVAQKLWGSDGHIVHIQNASVALRREEVGCIEVEDDIESSRDIRS